MKLERILNIFLLSYFEYHKIWLNIPMDDHHLCKIFLYFHLIFFHFHTLNIKKKLAKYFDG